MENRDSVLESRSSALASERHALEAKAGNLANLRGVFFVGFLICFITYFTWGRKLALLIGAVLFLLLFIVFVVIHGKLKSKAQRLVVLSEINDRYIARTKHDFSKLSDDGSDLAPDKHPYSSDLDLFGEKSLFSLISVAHTTFGRSQLKKWLLYASEENMDLEDIRSRQKAVAELSEQLVLMEELEASTELNVKGRGSPRALIAFVDSDSVAPGKRILMIRIINTILLWVSFIVALIFGGYVFFVPLTFFVIQLLLMAWVYPPISSSARPRCWS